MMYLFTAEQIVKIDLITHYVYLLNNILTIKSKSS